MPSPFPRPALAAAALLAAAIAPGCGERPAGDRPVPPEAPARVLLISVDTLRRDHLGCYGYPRATSPHVDALARRGATYTDLMTVAPWTLPSHTSLLTGLMPANHRVREDSAELPPGIRTIAEVYRDAGYRTVGVVSHDYVSSVFGLDRGFDRFDDSLIRGFQENPRADQVVDRLLELLPADPETRFFAFVHFFDPHWKYDAPPAFDDRFTDPDYAGAVTGDFAAVPATSGSALPPPDLAELRGLYDAEIAGLDAEIGRLLATMEERGLGDDLLVVFTADHGEEFQDHGGLGHGRSVFEEQIRVPLVLAGLPQFRDPVPRRRPSSLIDIAPTLADVLDSPARDGFEGLSLLQPGADQRVRVSGTIQLGGMLHAARLGRFKWIRSSRGEAGFDLGIDAGERYPFGEDPTGGRLKAALDQYLASAEHGWHLRIHAMDGPPLTCRATVRTTGRFVRVDRNFSRMASGDDGEGKTRFDAFETSADGKELRVDVTTSGMRGEIVFETEPPDAPVQLEIAVESEDPAAGAWAGAGTPLPQDQPVEIVRADPRLQGLPRGYPRVPSGVYVRAVDPPGEVTLPEASEERLRALGYLD